VIGFVVTSMLCGAAVSLGQIVVFRLLQGIFGAPLVPLSQSVLLDAYPPEQQGQAMACSAWRCMPRDRFSVDARRVGSRILTTGAGYSTLMCLSARYALSASCCSSKARREALADGSTGSAFATLGLGIGALQLFLDRGERLDWSPRAKKKIQIEAALACSLLLLMVHTLSGATRSSIPRYSAIGISDRIILIFCRRRRAAGHTGMLTPYLERLMN